MLNFTFITIGYEYGVFVFEFLTFDHTEMEGYERSFFSLSCSPTHIHLELLFLGKHFRIWNK